MPAGSTADPGVLGSLFLRIRPIQAFQPHLLAHPRMPPHSPLRCRVGDWAGTEDEPRDERRSSVLEQHSQVTESGIAAGDYHPLRPQG